MLECKIKYKVLMECPFGINSKKIKLNEVCIFFDGSADELFYMYCYYIYYYYIYLPQVSGSIIDIVFVTTYIQEKFSDMSYFPKFVIMQSFKVKYFYS